MIRLQNNYAITSSGGSFALVTFAKGKDKEGNEIDVQKPISYLIPYNARIGFTELL